MSSSNRSDAVHYDRVCGVVLLSHSSGSTPTEYTDVAALAEAIVAGAVQDALLPAVAGYGLALAARQHSDWPTESRRAALIQTAQLLRSACPSSTPLDQMLDDAITHANNSLMRGDTDVERTLADFVAAHI